MNFAWFFKLFFSICSMILHMSIPIILFSSFSTWGFHSHFVGVKYTTRESIGRSIVYFGSSSCFSPYTTVHLTCVFLSLTNNTYILGFISYAIFTFLQLQEELLALGLLVQPTKCVVYLHKVQTTLYRILLTFLLSTRIFIFWLHQ